MIGCPSDVSKEVEIAKNIILNWSMINAETQHIALLPLHWSTDAYPISDNPPQKSIDKQLVEKSDLLICIFASKIGSPTDTAESGSIEEIEEHAKAGKPVMLYFRNQVDVSKVDIEALRKLDEFKKKVQHNCLYWDYNDENDFKELLSRQLQQFINDNWIGQHHEKINSEQNQDAFSQAELNFFYDWANSPSTTYFAHKIYGGLVVQLGSRIKHTFKDSRDLAEYEDLMDRLLKAGYIKIEKRNTQGIPFYSITKKGYDFAKPDTD